MPLMGNDRDDAVVHDLCRALSDEERKFFHLSVSELARQTTFLPDKSEETALSTVAALWHTATGEPTSAKLAVSKALPLLTSDARERLADFVTRRAEGVPLAHLTGRQQFMGIEMLVDPGALIPRRETELLGQAALLALQSLLSQQPNATVIDVCTGSGNLALAIAALEHRATVFASDMSSDAIALAQRNAQHLALAERITFFQGDLLAPFDCVPFLGQIDLLICNPPYISSGKVDTMPAEIAGHEPRLAFDGGPLGISILMRLIADAPRYLKRGGILAFEIGAGQGRGIRRRLEQGGRFASIQEVIDATGQVRACVATFAGQS